MTSRIKQFFTFLSLIMAATDSEALTPSQVFQKIKDSVVVVKTLDTKGKTVLQGSECCLPSGKIGTNCHVVNSGARFQVGGGGDSCQQLCGAETTTRTFACWWQRAHSQTSRAGHEQGTDSGHAGVCRGGPIGLELSLSDGIVSQLRGNNAPLIQTTAAISPGSSGGGTVRTRKVDWSGFTTLYIEGGQSLNFAMPVEWVAEIKAGEKKIVRRRNDADWWKRGAALRPQWIGRTG